MTAGRSDSLAAKAALEELCRAYWYPVYAFIRKNGYSPPDAQDATQSFFGNLLAGNWITRADPAKGRFRTFLLGGVKHFLLNEWQKHRRLKRGAGVRLIELDGLEAEERYRIEPAELDSPDKLFERRWALTLLDRVLRRLRAEQTAATATRFEALQPALLGEPSTEGYAELARQWGVTESTVKSWVFRLRRRYRQLLRDEVSPTVESPDAVLDELRHLFRILSER
jgi:RNA polymerase sigma-70 factor (ECF subfamily)